jgi:hypothetical protein
VASLDGIGWMGALVSGGAGLPAGSGGGDAYRWGAEEAKRARGNVGCVLCYSSHRLLQ